MRMHAANNKGINIIGAIIVRLADIKMAKLDNEVLHEREVGNKSNAEYKNDNMNTSLISNTLVIDNEVNQLKDKSKEMNEMKSRNMKNITDIKIESKNENNEINMNAAMAENKEKRLPINNIEISNENVDNLDSLPVLETNEIEINVEEAEAQCACLESIGLASGSITDDSDIWLFGLKVVVKDMFNSKRAATFFNIKDIEEHLHLTRNKMIIVALCSGSDYTTGVLGVGPKTTLEIIKEFEGEDFECLKKFKQWCQNVQDDELKISNKKLQKLRGVKLGSNFPSQDVVNAYLKPVVDESTVEFTWGLPDVEGLREFAEKSMGWSRTKLNETLLPVIKRMHSCVSKQSKHVNINRKKTKMANAKIDKFLVKRTAAEQKEPMLSEPSSDSE